MTTPDLRRALLKLATAAEQVPYHRDPKGGPNGYPPEGHRQYSCPLCLALIGAREALAQAPAHDERLDVERLAWALHDEFWDDSVPHESGEMCCMPSALRVERLLQGGSGADMSNRNPGPDFQVAKQEAIQETTGDYLELLERMVEQGRQRNDPTLAVAISIEALDRLVREVRGSRSEDDENPHPSVWNGLPETRWSA